MISDPKSGVADFFLHYCENAKRVELKLFSSRVVPYLPHDQHFGLKKNNFSSLEVDFPIFNGFEPG